MSGVEASDLSNEAWLAGLRARDADVLDALRERICLGLQSSLGHRAEAGEADLDDFAQEAVLRVMDKLDSYRSEARFTTWAMALAVRLSLTKLRRRSRKDVSLDASVAASLTDESIATEAATHGARGEMFNLLRQGVAQALTERQRQVIVAELDGVPQVVLAEQLKVSPGAVYKTSHDARRKLKAFLSDAGYDSDTVGELLDAR